PQHALAVHPLPPPVPTRRSSDLAQAYAQFTARLRELLNPLGGIVLVDLPPKTSAAQRGALYEGHDYRLLGDAADYVFLMTYEWGDRKSTRLNSSHVSISYAVFCL